MTIKIKSFWFFFLKILPDTRYGWLHKSASAAFINGLARCLNLGVSLLTVPLLLNKYGPRDFGIWATTISLFAFGSFLDLGLSNALLNKVARAHIEEDFASAQRQISCAMLLLGITSTAVILITFLVLLVFDVGMLFGVSTFKAEMVFLALFIPFVLTLPFSIAQRVMLATGNAVTDAYWQIFSSIFQGASLLLVTKLNVGVSVAVFAWSLAPSVTRLLQYKSLKQIHRSLCFSWKNCNLATIRSFKKPALLFFVLQASVAGTFLSDTLVISRYLGPVDAGTYTIANRFFAIPIALQGLLLAPLWPQMTKKFHQDDIPGVRRISIKLWIGAITVGCLFTVAGILVREPLFEKWTRGQGTIPSLQLVSIIGIWTLIQLIGAVNGILLNAAEVVRFQLVISLMTVIFSISAKIYGVKSFGLEGLVLFSAIAYFGSALIPSLWFIRKVLLSPVPNRTQMGNGWS